MPKFEESAEFEIKFMPFSLDPSLPGGSGVDKQERRKRLMKERGSSEEESQARMGRTKAAYAAEGINLSYAGRTGNSFDAHRLVRLARSQGKEDPLVEELYSNYHESELCLSEMSVLLAAAKKAGVKGAEEFLRSDQDKKELKAQYEHYAQYTNSVPFFIINEKYTECGAPEASYLEALFTWLVNQDGPYTPGGHMAGSPPIQPEEKRRCPGDGQVYRFKEWLESYGKRHTITELTEFWFEQMTPADSPGTGRRGDL